MITHPGEGPTTKVAKKDLRHSTQRERGAQERTRFLGSTCLLAITHNSSFWGSDAVSSIHGHQKCTVYMYVYTQINVHKINIKNNKKGLLKLKVRIKK